MRLPGWCTQCHKIKLVRVNAASMATGTVHGVCAQCEDDKRRRR